MRVLGTVLVFALGCGRAERPEAETAAPEFPSQATERWVGTPTTLASLRGKVVLVEVWSRH